MGRSVARVLCIEGGMLAVERNSIVRILRENDVVFVGDILEARGSCRAVIEFDLGGQAVIGAGTKAQVTSAWDAEQAGSPFNVRAGSIWTKFREQKSHFQIQTAGGVAGIEDIGLRQPKPAGHATVGSVRSGTRYLGNKDWKERYRETLRKRRFVGPRR